MIKHISENVLEKLVYQNNYDNAIKQYSACSMISLPVLKLHLCCSIMTSFSRYLEMSMDFPRTTSYVGFLRHNRLRMCLSSITINKNKEFLLCNSLSTLMLVNLLCCINFLTRRLLATLLSYQ